MFYDELSDHRDSFSSPQIIDRKNFNNPAEIYSVSLMYDHTSFERRDSGLPTNLKIVQLIGIL